MIRKYFKDRKDRQDRAVEYKRQIDREKVILHRNDIVSVDEFNSCFSEHFNTHTTSLFPPIIPFMTGRSNDLNERINMKEDRLYWLANLGMKYGGFPKRMVNFNIHMGVHESDLPESVKESRKLLRKQCSLGKENLIICGTLGKFSLLTSKGDLIDAWDGAVIKENGLNAVEEYLLAKDQGNKMVNFWKKVNDLKVYPINYKGGGGKKEEKEAEKIVEPSWGGPLFN